MKGERGGERRSTISPDVRGGMFSKASAVRDAEHCSSRFMNSYNIPAMEIRDPTVFLDYLASTHQRTRRVIACIPSEDIEWAPAAGKFSFGDLVRHLANIERYMYAETVHGKPSRYAGQSREYADGYAATVAYYDRLHEESRLLFAALSVEQMNTKCVTPAGVPITVYKWLRAMFEHEAHHRGQLYLMLGLRGVATPPIYGLTAEELAAKSRAS